jgi:hypothetical protein
MASTVTTKKTSILRAGRECPKDNALLCFDAPRAEKAIQEDQEALLALKLGKPQLKLDE